MLHRMARLLNTYTGRFVWLTDVGETPYAILSHTWRHAGEGGEQTYDELVKIQSCIKPNEAWASCLDGTLLSHPELSAKIKGICEVARKAGYMYVWIDSCCIDKRSSAELSEAINSMYALYRNAAVCYVYLADVPDGTDPREEDSDFWTSRWHKRGWTLQELIAPARVVFLTLEWTFLGTKTGLASTLEKITRVDAAILTGAVSVSAASVAKRMSWAVGRETTRLEDRAYSLLGLFGVHMSPIYGEGINAFLRLQEEIIKHIPDQSIFAWGWHSPYLPLTFYTLHGPRYWLEAGLLASSPDAFAGVGDVIPISPSAFGTRIGLSDSSIPPPLHCVFTAQGIRVTLVHVPFASLPRETRERLSYTVDCQECNQLAARCPIRSLALLRCEDGVGDLIALPLRCPEQDLERAENIAVGFRPSCGDIWHELGRFAWLSVDVLKDLDITLECIETSVLRHCEVPPHEIKTRNDPPELYLGPAAARDQEFLLTSLAPECEEELHAVGFALKNPLKCQWSDVRPEYTLTITLERITQDSPYRAPMRSSIPNILIQLELLVSQDHNVTPRFSISFPGSPSAAPSTTRTESQGADLAIAEEPDGHTPYPPLTILAADVHHHEAGAFNTFSILGLAHPVRAEAIFTVPDHWHAVYHPDDARIREDHVRVLRITLKRRLYTADTSKDESMLTFSVELSEPFEATSNLKTMCVGRSSTASSIPVEHLPAPETLSAANMHDASDIASPTIEVPSLQVLTSSKSTTHPAPVLSHPEADIRGTTSPGPTAPSISGSSPAEVVSSRPLADVVVTEAICAQDGSAKLSADVPRSPRSTRQAFRDTCARLLHRLRRRILPL
ncbi:heterokaryon incompatibility protein-domain-containing protein [Lenzites betulinus]|nr:heterokaryon incompatibility protein-domain-containing protein [Lenzites betulinus]